MQQICYSPLNFLSTGTIAIIWKTCPFNLIALAQQKDPQDDGLRSEPGTYTEAGKCANN
jgi:hypothetical protein